MNRSTGGERERRAVRIDSQGRLVIPAELRRELGIEPGEELLAWLEQDRLIVATRAALVREFRGMWRDVAPDRSLVDELLAEQRAEYELEKAEASGDPRRIARAHRALARRHPR